MKRNLIYYLYPRQCSMLSLNLHLLQKYQSIFNGRRIFLVVEGPELIVPYKVNWLLDDTHRVVPYEMVTRPNVPNMGEAAYYLEMMNMVYSTDPNEVTFFAHSKGVSADICSRRGTTIEELSVWVENMYRLNLSDPSAVDEALRVHPCAGTFKYTEVYGSMKTPWYYAGTFFWVNHQKMFTPDWKKGTGTRYAAEEYLGNRFSYDEAHNFGGEKFQEIHNLYKRDKLMKCCTIERNWDSSRVTIVTTCKNRWNFLSRSLNSWIQRGFKEILIVDWSSDSPIADQLKSLPSDSTPVSVLRVEGETVFNAGMARNLGSRQVNSDYILFIDSDMVIRDWDLAPYIPMVSGRFYHGPNNVPLFSTLLVKTEDFRRVNGYSELYPAYGWEDNDLYLRLEQSGLDRRYYDDRMLEHIEHSDELRTQHRGQNGKQIFETVRDNKKIEAWTPGHKQSDKSFIRITFML